MSKPQEPLAYDPWFVDEAARWGMTPQAYAVALAIAIEAELRDLVARLAKPAATAA
jgi:hypothetical protein